MVSYLVLLGRHHWFPPPDHAPAHGLLALGGDLSVGRLLLAHRMGIFPWFSEETPIMWYSPDPRFVLKLNEWHLSARLARTIRSGRFEVRFDSAFKEVITACADVPRPGQEGTWITEGMKSAYCNLHAAGYAHCAEAWRDGSLVGGVYGVSLGRIFFGESMFHTERDASKVALAALVHRLQSREHQLLDCQQETGHLARFGARAITRTQFLRLLDQAMQYETEVGPWRD